MTPFAGKEIKLQVRAEERFPDDVESQFRSALYHTLKIPVNQPVVARKIQQPAMKIVSCDSGNNGHARLRVHITDDNPQYVALFQDEDKIDLKLASMLTENDYIASIPLKPGVNSIRLLVTDDDDVSDLLPLRLWGKDEDAKDEKPVVKTGEPSIDSIP
jgi:hypothetical protein